MNHFGHTDRSYKTRPSNRDKHAQPARATEFGTTATTQNWMGSLWLQKMWLGGWVVGWQQMQKCKAKNAKRLEEFN